MDHPGVASAADSPALVVGLGASAGGIRALKEFFTRVPPDAGAVYVVILHLSPDHDSRLAEVLQSATTMPVAQVRETTTVQRDHVYVIPPHAILTIVGGQLRVTEPTPPEQRRSPVDVFFRTLAAAFGPRAVAVVLSGTGANGSSGIKHVKEQGGLCIVQDPDEAEYADMPQSSLATGVIDYVLPVADIPSAIVDYQRRLNSSATDREPAVTPEGEAKALREIVSLLRVRTGHDFSNYKPPTVRRRIERRMMVTAQPTLAAYAALLKERADEPAALMRELLISVTNFFRDPEAYAALERLIVPRMFRDKHGHDQVRAWVAGCATGEEAYSVAMLLAECASDSANPPAIQVFASDLDARAIAIARAGRYTEAEVADVPEERLRRFFRSVNGGYRVGPELRELVLFANHNVIKDPPFSHLDLVACRNLLIYLNRSIQGRLLETFHFALLPGGYLFLGGAEAPEPAGDFFVPVDKASRLYESRSVTTRVAAAPAAEVPEAKPSAALSGMESPLSNRLSMADVHQRLLDEYAPPSIVVSEDHRILHVSDRAARYLEIGGGEPSRDLLKLILPELRADLRTALHQAMRVRVPVTVGGVQVSPEHGGETLRVVVRPVLRSGDPSRGLLLILFEPEATMPDAAAPTAQLTSPAEAVTQLEEELARVSGELRTTIEHCESQVEEAKASNEELQAVNEELRSAAEELETGKEELQSVNEELTTVNQELKIKIEELALTNSDFQNYINATDIGTIFLDRNFRIKLFTERAKDVFNLQSSDLGRRLSDITNSLTYGGLHDDLHAVLDRLQTVEREVQTPHGQWYLMRVLPYRTADNRIDGVSISFLDITSRRSAEGRAKTGEDRLRLLIDSAVDYAIFTMTSDGRIDSWNPGAERMFGYRTDEIVGQSAAVLFTPEDRAAGVPARELARAREQGRAADDRFHVRNDGTRFYCSGVTTRLGHGPSLGLAKIARDLTAQREAEEALTEAHAGLEASVQERTRELREEIVQRTAAQVHVTSLMRKLVTAQEDERARIARDLHDQLGQQLTALRLTLERYRAKAAAAGPIEELDRAAALTREINAELDFLAWELRPAALDDLGLLAALPRYLREWSDHYKIPAEFRSSTFAPHQLSRDAEVTFYRVAQEALNNIAKHAQATRVDVLLEARDGSVVLVIEDDGVGFDPADPAIAGHGIGLVGMRERASLSGATLELESIPGEGTTIFLRRAVEPNPQEEGSGPA